MTQQTPDNPLLAALMISSATAFIAATTLIAKALATGALGPALHPLQVSQARFVFAFLVFAGFFLLRRPGFKKVHWGLNLGRTLCGWAGLTLMFTAVTRIPLTDATAISFLNPVFAMILAIPLLGEKVGPVRWTAAAIAFAGALILLRPTPGSFQPAALLALVAAGFMGLELIFIKTLSRREPLAQILLVNNLIGACIASAVAFPVWQTPEPLQWLALAAIGVIMACAQALFINGMARADASFAAPFSYCTLIFAALYDFLGFREVPDAVSLLGAAIILSGALLLVLREARARRLAVPPPLPPANTP